MSFEDHCPFELIHFGGESFQLSASSSRLRTYLTLFFSMELSRALLENLLQTQSGILAVFQTLWTVFHQTTQTAEMQKGYHYHANNAVTSSDALVVSRFFSPAKGTKHVLMER